MIDASEWRLYIPTPLFAERVSGHSPFSAAASEVLRRPGWDDDKGRHRGSWRPGRPASRESYILDLTIFCSMLKTPLDFGSTFTFTQ